MSKSRGGKQTRKPRTVVTRTTMSVAGRAVSLTTYSREERSETRREAQVEAMRRLLGGGGIGGARYLAISAEAVGVVGLGERGE